jgi:hypothetical protein
MKKMEGLSPIMYIAQSSIDFPTKLRKHVVLYFTNARTEND